MSHTTASLSFLDHFTKYSEFKISSCFISILFCFKYGWFIWIMNQIMCILHLVNVSLKYFSIYWLPSPPCFLAIFLFSIELGLFFFFFPSIEFSTVWIIFCKLVKAWLVSVLFCFCNENCLQKHCIRKCLKSNMSLSVMLRLVSVGLRIQWA